MMRHGFWVVCFAVLLGTSGTVVAQESTERFEKVAQRLVRAINAQDYSAIQQDLSQAMLDALPVEKAKPFFADLVDQFGKIEKLDAPRRTGPNQAVFFAHCAQQDLEITVSLDEHNKIAGLSFLQPTQAFEKVAQRLVQAINAQDYPAIRQDFSQVMLDALPLEKAKPFFTNLVDQFGKIEKLDAPRRMATGRAVFPAHCARRDLEITVVLDERGKIAGLSFLPPTPAIPVPDRLVTSFRLPFEGQWMVLWGGDSSELNHHHDLPNQRFAFDFVVVDAAGRSHRGEGKENKDYYAFGQPVLAPADGVVTDVVTGVRDNTPGSMNPAFAGGNSVVIMHREHEVSVLGHLQQGSIRVKRGDKVKRGQLLGLCGNSGYSSEPHIHFHVQNTPIIQDGTGLRCVFEKITVTKDGKSESRTDHSPVKGDIVRQE